MDTRQRIGIVVMKECSHCHIEKSLTEFDVQSRSKDGLQRYCKSCRKEITAKHYTNNKEQIVEKSIARQRYNAERFKQLKSTFKCHFCDENTLVCLDFHHLDSTQKEFTVSYAVRHYGWNKLLKEIGKCIVVCKNCHAKVHEGILAYKSPIV